MQYKKYSIRAEYSKVTGTEMAMQGGGDLTGTKYYIQRKSPELTMPLA